MKFLGICLASLALIAGCARAPIERTEAQTATAMSVAITAFENTCIASLPTFEGLVDAMFAEKERLGIDNWFPLGQHVLAGSKQYGVNLNAYRANKETTPHTCVVLIKDLEGDAYRENARASMIASGYELGPETEVVPGWLQDGFKARRSPILATSPQAYLDFPTVVGNQQWAAISFKTE